MHWIPYAFNSLTTLPLYLKPYTMFNQLAGFHLTGASHVVLILVMMHMTFRPGHISNFSSVVSQFAICSSLCSLLMQLVILRTSQYISTSLWDSIYSRSSWDPKIKKHILKIPFERFFCVRENYWILWPKSTFHQPTKTPNLISLITCVLSLRE